jgi:hypothetical protein
MPVIRRRYGKIHKIIGSLYLGGTLSLGRNGIFKGGGEKYREMRTMPEGHYPRQQPRTRPYANASISIYLGPVEFHSQCNNEDNYSAYWRILGLIVGSHPQNVRRWKYWRNHDHTLGFSFSWLFQINKRGDN